MDLRNNQITIGEILSNPKAWMFLKTNYPMIAGHPMLNRVRGMTLAQAANFASRYIPQYRINQIIRQLESF